MPTKHISNDAMSEICKNALISEANAILNFSETCEDELINAIDLIAHSTGPLVVVGIGKSGHIARKISSSFSSIGKLSLFLHAAEASHGDLGQIDKNSVVLTLSNSGETAELFQIMNYCMGNDIPMIAITRDAKSTLGRNAKVTIAYGQLEEVCPNGLAPTTSTTLQLAIGDSLMVGVTHLLGSAPEDFHKLHPGGNLGAKFLKVADLMHDGDALPIVSPDSPMSEVIITISEKSFGIAVVIRDGEIEGIITDGDLRRNAKEIWNMKAEQVCSKNPVKIHPDDYAADALKIMSIEPERRPITCCIVADEENRLIGILHIHDCLRAGVS